MSEVVPLQDIEPLPDLGAAASGRALLLNATPSAITRIDVSTGSSPAGDVPGMTLFPASAPSGTGTIAGCSFPVPVATLFTITVAFDTGDEVAITTRTASTAMPALYLVAFLNGLVVAEPSGAASDIQFSSADAMVFLV